MFDYAIEFSGIVLLSLGAGLIIFGLYTELDSNDD